MQESAKSVKSVNANFLHFTNSCLSSTRGKYLGCFIHKFLSHCVRTIISHKIVTNLVKVPHIFAYVGFFLYLCTHN